MSTDKSRALVPSSQPETPTPEEVWIVTEYKGGGIRGVFVSQGDAEAEIVAICSEYRDLTRRDFIINVQRVRRGAFPVVQDEAPKAACPKCGGSPDATTVNGLQPCICEIAWKGDTVAIEAVLAKHWLFELRCNHELKTDQAVCACGVYRGKDELSVGAAVRSWAKHVTAEIAAALGASRPSPADRKEK